MRQKLVAFILECKEELAEIEKKLLTHIVNSLVKSPRILDKDYFENGYMQVETLVSILNCSIPESLHTVTDFSFRKISIGITIPFLQSIPD